MSPRSWPKSAMFAPSTRHDSATRRCSTGDRGALCGRPRNVIGLDQSLFGPASARSGLMMTLDPSTPWNRAVRLTCILSRSACARLRPPLRRRRLHDHAGGRPARRHGARRKGGRESRAHRSGPAHGRLAPSGGVPAVHAGAARDDGARCRRRRRLHVATAGAGRRTGRQGVGAARGARRGAHQAARRRAAGELYPRVPAVRRSRAPGCAEARSRHARAQLPRHHVSAGRSGADESATVRGAEARRPFRRRRSFGPGRNRHLRREDAASDR